MSIPQFSVRNHVLVNVLMLVILAAGGAFAFTLVREMFPEVRPDRFIGDHFPSTVYQHQTVRRRRTAGGPTEKGQVKKGP